MEDIYILRTFNSTYVIFIQCKSLFCLLTSYEACCCKLAGRESGPQRQKCAQFTFMLRIFQNYPNHARHYYGGKTQGRLQFQVQCPCPVAQKGLVSELPGRKINFSFPNVFETQSEDWLIENPDPFDQAAPGSSCQTICVISSDFCLRGEVTVKRETWRMGENGKYQMNETKSSSPSKTHSDPSCCGRRQWLQSWWRGGRLCVIIYCVWFLAVPSLLLYCDVFTLAWPVTVSLGAHAAQEPGLDISAPGSRQGTQASYWSDRHTQTFSLA